MGNERMLGSEKYSIKISESVKEVHEYMKFERQCNNGCF
jgi:hypothetical protein